VGSNKSKLITSIDENLDSQSGVNIKLKATQSNSGKIEINYSIDGSGEKDEQAVLLLVQKMATNKIGRGENEGKTLHHINIVREISYLSFTSKEATKTFDLPSELKKEDVFVAGFMQDKKSGKIKAIQSSPIE
jgi:hypothetical protein